MHDIFVEILFLSLNAAQPLLFFNLSAIRPYPFNRSYTIYFREEQKNVINPGGGG